jgi:MOSC domain-containing protein YiiM
MPRWGSGLTLSLAERGLRDPCGQIDDLAPGLLKQVAEKTVERIVCKMGIMTIALASGTVGPGDIIRVEPSEGPRIPLERV